MGMEAAQLSWAEGVVGMAAVPQAAGVGNAAVVWGSLSQSCLHAEHLKQARVSHPPAFVLHSIKRLLLSSAGSPEA